MFTSHESSGAQAPGRGSGTGDEGHASRRLSIAVLALASVLAFAACSAAVQGGIGAADGGAVAAPLDAATTTTTPLIESEPGPQLDDGSAAEPSSVDSPAPQDVPPVPAGEPPAAVSSTQAAEGVYPVRVHIPSIGVDADVVDLGLNPDGTLEVPSDFAETGWYTGRSVPGNVGPSVVVGHIDSKKGPAVFYRLRDLDAGDTIEIHRSDGMVAMFRVSESELVDKDVFPTDRVYGSTTEPTLRLITCGGSFDRSAGSYRGNLIVFGEHLGTYQPTPDGALTS